MGRPDDQQMFDIALAEELKAHMPMTATEEGKPVEAGVMTGVLFTVILNAIKRFAKPYLEANREYIIERCLDLLAPITKQNPMLVAVFRQLIEFALDAMT